MYHGFQLVHQIKCTTSKKLFLILSSLEEKIGFKSEKPTTSRNLPILRDTSLFWTWYTFHTNQLIQLNSLNTLLTVMPASR